jgi:outer membrane protein TolC
MSVLWPVTFVVYVAVTLAPRAGAQQTNPDSRIQESIRAVVAQSGGAGGTAIGPVQTIDPAQGTTVPALPPDTRHVVAVTLEDAVKLALDRNLNIAVQRLNPQGFDPALAALQSTYRPTFTSLAAAQSGVNPPTSSIVGVPPGATGVTLGTGTFNAGLTQNMSVGGGQLALTLNNVRSASTSTTVLYNPTYNPSYSVQYTQPLLRGMSIDPSRQQILVTKIARDISDIQLASTITNTLSNVREAYWNYVYSVQAVDVAQQSVNLASELVRDNIIRMQVGTMAPLDVVTAQSQQAQAQQGLVQAIGMRDAAELALKQLIVSGTEDPNWAVRLDPVDRPDFEPVDVDVEQAIRLALGQRTDLAQAKKSLEANAVTYKFLKNQLLPQADVSARYGLSGLGGTQFVRQGSAINSPIVSTLPGGFTDALSSLVDSKYPTWNVQFNLSVPIGSNVATASMVSAKIQMEQNTSQLHQIELQVATEVTSAAISVRNGIQAVRAAQAAQELAQKAYEAEEAKLDVGFSTNYNVILALNALNAAKTSNLQAVLNYRNALVELDRLQHTTLTALNVTLLSGPAWTSASPAVSNLNGAPVGSVR